MGGANNIGLVGGPAGIEAFFSQCLPNNVLENTDLWGGVWQWQFRSATTFFQWDFSFNLSDVVWPMMHSGAFNDPGGAYGFFMCDQATDCIGGDWEPWHYGMGGSMSSKYVMGQCLNSIGNPTPYAVVQGFVTATDGYVGEIMSDDKGYYEVRCPQTPSNQHYMVAYLSGSPDITGATVNTLVPTFRDGS